MIQATTLPPAIGGEPRGRMRVLDGCLRLLEDACAAGHRTVPLNVARLIAPHVAGVSTGMPMARAMDVVFNQQRSDLLARNTTPDQQISAANRRVGVVHPTVALTRDEAEVLTARIRAGARDLSLLVLEAHERRAWRALSYRTWDSYVRAELGLSRSRSYELIDHARVLITLKSAANLIEYPNISPHVADQIRPMLGTVVDEIRRRSHSGSGRKAVQDAVRAALAAIKRDRATQSTRRVEMFEPERLARAVDYLSSLPPPSTVAGLLAAEQIQNLKGLASAADWLTALARELSTMAVYADRDDTPSHRSLAVVS